MIDPASLEILHAEQDGRGMFYIEREGRRVAEQVYRREAADRVVVTHTEVDPSLRGLGIARRLLDALVAWARATGTGVAATCTYASGQFDRDASIRDVFVG